MNELLLIITLLISFGGTLLFLKAFGKGGLFAWVGICTLFANIEVTIVVHAFGMDQTLGNTLFAATFLATDILSEIYGKKKKLLKVCLPEYLQALLLFFFLLCGFITFLQKVTGHHHT